MLYMAAVVATRCNPHVEAVYDRLLAQGKSKMSADAQAGAFVLRRNQNSKTLSARLCENRLMKKTVSTRAVVLEANLART